jgi:hypothetical protein
LTITLKQVGSVVVIVAREELSMGDADQMMATLDEAYRSGRPYAVLIDGRGVAAPSADVRRRLGESPGKAEEIAADRGKYTVAVIDSTVLRGVMTAIQWFLPKAVRLRAVSTAVEAFGILREVDHPKGPEDVAALTVLVDAIDADWASAKHAKRRS